MTTTQKTATKCLFGEEKKKSRSKKSEKDVSGGTQDKRSVSKAPFRPKNCARVNKKRTFYFFFFFFELLPFGFAGDAVFFDFLPLARSTAAL